MIDRSQELTRADHNIMHGHFWGRLLFCTLYVAWTHVVWLASYTQPYSTYYCLYHVERYLFSWEESLGFFAGSTVNLLRSHAARQPGVLLVTLQASSGILLMAQDYQCMSGAFFADLLWS